MGKNTKKKNRPEDDRPTSGKAESSTNDIVMKESPDDVLISADPDKGELKEEIKKEAERNDVLSRFLIPLFTFILIAIGIAALTWYYAKPERVKESSSEEKMQTPPVVTEAPEPAAQTQTPTTPPPTTQAREEVYTVKEGDTLSSIANAYGMTSTELAAYNGITNPESLTIGQTIKIPVK